MVNVVYNPSFEEFFTISPWEFDGTFRIVPEPVPIPPISYADAPEPGLFSFEATSDGLLAQHVRSLFIDPDFPFLVFFYEGIAPLGVGVHYTEGPLDWTRLQVDTWNAAPVPNYDGWGMAHLPVDTTRPVRRLEITIDTPRPRLRLDCFYLDGEEEDKMRREPRFQHPDPGFTPAISAPEIGARSQPDRLTRLDAHLFNVERKLDRLLAIVEPKESVTAKTKSATRSEKKPGTKRAGKSTATKKQGTTKRKR